MDIVEIKQLIVNNEMEKAIEIFGSLSSDELNFITNYLLKEIVNTSDGNTRNMVAYFLGEIKCQGAANTMIDLVFDEKLRNNRGTLISALSKLDCKEYIYQLLPLLYEGNYEVVMNTYMLLQDCAPKIDILEQKKCVDFVAKKIDYYEGILSTLYDVYENILGQKLDD